MARAIQKRTLATRAKLLSVAENLVRKAGYEALRVEEIVLGAGVAKGTFFAHFRDKDALMDILIGARIDALLDMAEAGPPPESAAALVRRLHDLHAFMASERYVFDVILRHSGAAGVSEIGPIANTFGRYHGIVVAWMTAEHFRRDVGPEMLADGVQAFAIQAIALNFCALHRSVQMDTRLTAYLQAWLTPAAG